MQMPWNGPNGIYDDMPDVAVDAPEGGINAIGAIRFRDVQEDTFD